MDSSDNIFFTNFTVIGPIEDNLFPKYVKDLAAVAGVKGYVFFDSHRDVYVGHIEGSLEKLQKFEKFFRLQVNFYLLKLLFDDPKETRSLYCNTFEVLTFENIWDTYNGAN
ncbi:uncharacterized protein LOC119662696 [Teleopsis dalmanni]|uniref:uncharacterized protein LOC119662696 n=1 Tax=Teleopsis dalmanni TaxID=139649 RepID=UPI0018CE2444|nr:uncharacterized protein LOC119662696 [Teleopsis dalmanni]